MAWDFIISTAARWPSLTRSAESVAPPFEAQTRKCYRQPTSVTTRPWTTPSAGERRSCRLSSRAPLRLWTGLRSFELAATLLVHPAGYREKGLNPAECHCQPVGCQRCLIYLDDLITDSLSYGGNQYTPHKFKNRSFADCRCSHVVAARWA